MNVYSVDRIEGDCAVLVGENAPDLLVPMVQLPEGVKEGSVIRMVGDVYVLDPAEEQRRRQRILSLQDKLRRKS